MASFKIVGDINPVVGVPTIYSVVALPREQSFPFSSPDLSIDFALFSSKTKWKMWMHQYGYWRSVKGDIKIGETVIFTFLQKSLRCRGLRMAAEINGEEVVVDIAPQRTNQAEILKVEILNSAHDKPTKKFAYGDLITARVHAVKLDLTSVVVTLWENDSDGEGHRQTNTFIEVKEDNIINGRADVDFLLSPNFSALANDQYSPGDKSEGSKHEYYVTAESIHSEPKLVASSNFNIANDVVMPTIHPVNSLVTVEVAEEGEEGKTGNCVCKENNFHWSNDLTCAERKKVLEVCTRLWGEDKKKQKASELMSIFHLETGGEDARKKGALFSPSADNGVGFSGLIQFSDSSAEKLGTTRNALKKMTFIEQMSYVESYLAKKKDKLNTMTDLYLLVLKPNAVGKGNELDFKLFDESISVPDGNGSSTSYEQRKINIQREPWVTKYGYSSNPTFMKGDEHTQMQKWVYTKQRYQLRWGHKDGNTTIKKVKEILEEAHYNPGAAKLFNGECKDVVEKKKEVVDGERAPWMKVALEEAKSYGGKDEDEIDERIRKYHSDGGGISGSGSDTAWCASFVCWCLDKSGNKSPKSAGSRMFLDSKNVEKCDIFYGAVAIFSDCDSTGTKMQSSGHATFIFGEISNNVYACLGGNQGDMLKMSKYDCSGDVFVSWAEGNGKKHYKIFRGFYKPKNYEISDSDKLNENDKYLTADEASKKALNLNIKSSESGEKSR